MAEKKPLINVAVEFISKEVGDSLKRSGTVRANKTSAIVAVIGLLASAQLTEAEAYQAYATLRLVAISAREGGLKVADALDEMLAALVKEHRLPAGSV